MPKRQPHACCPQSRACDSLYSIVGAWCRGETPGWQMLDNEEWDSLVAQARAHAVSGLLYRIMPDNAPAAVCKSLQHDYQSQMAGNMLYTQHLAQIVTALRNAGVRFAVVKGAALLATVYPDPAIRAMKDVDLLVHLEDVNILKPVMAYLGWQEEDEDIAGGQFGERYRAETSFTRQEGTLLLRVEAHLDVPGFYPPSRRGIWNKVTMVTGAGIGEMPVLTLPTHLSYLCAHYYYHHCGSGLKWLVDVAVLASRVTSWHDVVVDAYQFGTTRPVHLALHDVAKYLQVPVPQHVVETLRFLPMSISLRLLFELCKRPKLHYLGVRLLDLYRAPNWHTRLGYIWRKLTAPRWRGRPSHR